MLYHSGATIARGGFLGVDAFFVLSGFLITALLVEEWARTGSISFRQFYSRRALRLLPALFGVLLGSAAIALTIASPEMRDGTWRGIVVTVLYVANWEKVFSNRSVGVLGHTWSLSIEEQFYLLWPPLLFVLLRRGWPIRRLLAITGSLAVAAAATRVGLLLSRASSTGSLYNGLHTRADSLLVGCAAALAFSSGLIPAGKWPRPLRLLVAGALPLALLACLVDGGVGSDDPHWYEFGFLLFAAAVAALILALVTNQVGGWVFSWRPLVWLGVRSYGIYLWHLPIHEAIKMLGLGASWPQAAYLALNVAPSLAIAALSYHFVEAPALALKKRLAGRPAALRVPLPADPVPAYALVRAK